MKAFFKVMDIDAVLALSGTFPTVGETTVDLSAGVGRVLAEDVRCDADLPGFARATMDGYAVRGASTFGASDGNPAYLTVKGAVGMGAVPDLEIGPGEAVRIPTGGMLPRGADSVVMIEHSEALDDTTIEVYRSVAPGQHVIEKGEDYREGQRVLARGVTLRPQEVGLLAAFGRARVRVFKRPVVGIISTGDEVVPVEARPGPGQIRDINSYTLCGQVEAAGGRAVRYGILRDDFDALYRTCAEALAQSDMILISGGSSVGQRDFTVDVLSALPRSEILAHGISISPGKPTILARVGLKAFWGLPGHVVSAMVVMAAVVRPFVEQIAGRAAAVDRPTGVRARLSRNLASVQGRVDYVRVRLSQRDGDVWAEPVLGKSGLINTMVRADGLITIDKDAEGLDAGTEVQVLPL